MDIVLNDLLKIRFEDGLLPLLQEEFSVWKGTFQDPDLVIESGSALEVGTPVLPGASFSANRYEIAGHGTLCSISSGKISCNGRLDEGFFDNTILKPVLIGLLAPKGWGLLHSTAASIGESVAVFPAITGTGKTFVLLELLRRGAGYVCNNNLIVGDDGRFVAYPKWIRLVERHFRMFPELLETAFADEREMRQYRSKISRLGFGNSVSGSNPISRLVKFYSKSAYFCHSVPSQTLFPGSEVRTTGKASHVFLLLRKKGQPRIVPSDAKRIASFAPATSSLGHMALHRNLSRLAGLRYPSEDDIINVFGRFLEHVHCYEIHMGESFTRSELSRIVDEIESRIA